MKIRNLLIIAFLMATVLPSAIFATWSYNTSLKREFDEVNDRHLLLAQNLGQALERYHTDLKATFDSISLSMVTGDKPKNVAGLMASVNLLHVTLYDRQGTPMDDVHSQVHEGQLRISPEQYQTAVKIARSRNTVFSDVMGSTHDGNVILAVRKYGNNTAIGIISTRYFVELGKSISFGTKGHAAIVDASGNVLAHPLDSWIESRKNIAKVSAVKRMLNGETGIEQFYSPALKGDMIAGLTSVKGAGWGVMIPQPVSELYDKVYANHKGVAYAFGVGVVLALLLSALFVEALATPIEQLLRNMLANAKSRSLKPSTVVPGLFATKEISQLNSSYNMMVKRVSSAHSRIEKMAFTDAITGLPNRDRLEMLAEEALGTKGGGVGIGTVFQVNVDNFKEINDLHGHTMGDQYLKKSANRLNRFFQSLYDTEFATDVRNIQVTRLGGDEFVVLLPNLAQPDQIKRILKLLVEFMSVPCDKFASKFANIRQCGVSVGAARYPQDGTTLADLLRKSDTALHHARKYGEGSVCLYDPQKAAMSEAEIRQEVEIAIAENHLRLEYQPKLNAKTGMVDSVEALVRWNHKKFGEISPAHWIPAIASSPLIIELGRWVMRQAMSDHAKWTAKGHNCKIAVNIGANHFSKPGFAHCLAEFAANLNFNPQNLEIEVTEDALFKGAADPSVVINELQAAGFSVAIDDFGTGYSNISRLNKLTFDTIKIDRSVIDSAYKSARGSKILKSIVAMANALNCATVAEGIEDEGMAELCRSAGVDQLQGFHYSRSLPFDKLLRWMSDRKSMQATMECDSERKVA